MTFSRGRSSFLSQPLPTGVKSLIVANVAIFVLYYLGSVFSGHPILNFLLLTPHDAVFGLRFWQFGTYMFFHSLGSFWHILFNMLALWMFGRPVEETWGTKRFVQYYLLCGVGAGVCVVAANLAFGDPYSQTLGASGAIYGLLLAFGMLFPEQEVLFSFLFPIRAKYLVMIFAAIAFLGTFRQDSAVSNVAHLGGMIFGFVYIRTQFSRRRRPAVGAAPGFDLARRWKEYKLQRAKRKFQVYMRKHGNGPLQ